MPRPRSLARSLVLVLDEKNVRSATLISPESGVSSPAMHLSVVVFPQPDGPKSVKSLPSGTSRVTSSTATTRSLWARLLPGNVLTRFSTLSTSLGLPDSDSCAQFPGDCHERNENGHHDDAVGCQFRVLPVLPLLPDDDRENLVTRRVQQDRAGQLAHRHREDVDPAGDEARHEQRNDHPPEALPPGGAGGLGTLLQFARDLVHGARRVAH